jgi:hypothetical protein
MPFFMSIIGALKSQLILWIYLMDLFNRDKFYQINYAFKNKRKPKIFELGQVFLKQRNN